MSLTKVVLALLIFIACIGVAEWSRRRRRRFFLKSHSVDAEQLHAMLSATDGTETVQVIDVRQPLDLLAHPQVIPGARRIAPKEILGNPELLSKDQDTIVYCTCPSDETAVKIMQKAVSLGFEKVKILHGGLDAWKEKSYTVEPYDDVFHLDTPA